MDESERTVLVVDDDETMREVLELRLRKWGFQVLLASDASEAEKVAEEADPDVILSDVVMPRLSGLDLVRKLQGEGPGRPMILLTAHGTVDMAVEAMKSGALDFITKPVNYPNLKVVLEDAFRELELRARSRHVARELEGERGFGPFVGRSPAMEAVYRLIPDFAGSDASVLITGESGTGKELAAQAIHRLSRRGDGPLVPVNAAAIPRDLLESEIFGHVRGAFTGAGQERTGCFELAHGGTLFLDEISEMPMELQPKLLRVLDEARFRKVGGGPELEVDVRVLSATNRDPRTSVREGVLREDLYYRLNVLTVELPPLRERNGDVGLLAHHYLERFSEKHGASVRVLDDDALGLLEAYRWPGNVRELRNVMERATILARGESVEAAHLPPYIRNPQASGEGGPEVPTGFTMAEVEKELILRTLDETAGNKAEAARRLGVNVKTIRNKLKSYGIRR